MLKLSNVTHYNVTRSRVSTESGQAFLACVRRSLISFERKEDSEIQNFSAASMGRSLEEDLFVDRYYMIVYGFVPGQNLHDVN